MELKEVLSDSCHNENRLEGEKEVLSDSRHNENRLEGVKEVLSDACHNENRLEGVKEVQSDSCPNNGQIEGVKEVLSSVCQFLLPLLPLVNAHVANFFSHRHWDRTIPAHLRTGLDEVDNDVESPTLLDRFFSLADGESGSGDLGSSELHSTLVALRGFTLPSLIRSHSHSLDPHRLGADLDTNEFEGGFVAKDCENGSSDADEGKKDRKAEAGEAGEISSIRRRRLGLSPKKDHEVEAMGFALLQLRTRLGFNTLVDVGCGLGYLEEELRQRLFEMEASGSSGVVGRHAPPIHTLPGQAPPCRKPPRHASPRHVPPLNILGIEGNETLLHGAHKRRKKLFRDSPDFLNWKNISVASTISRPEELTATIRGVLGEVDDNSSIVNPGGDAFLCGLHACGGLTSSTLKSYVQLAESDRQRWRGTGFFVVGCCYHKIAERRKTADDSFAFPLTYFPEESSAVDFPLSSFLLQRDFVLGQNARMSANQPLDRIRASDRRPRGSSFCCAVLEVILKELYSTTTPAKKTLNRKLTQSGIDDLQFLKMALTEHGFGQHQLPSDEVLRKQGFSQHPHMPSDEVLRRYLDRFEADRAKLTTFFDFRCLLGAVVETVVVLDRLLFILESGAVSKAALIQIFDPVVSPRCYALVGIS